jgi:hypothetical protein
MSVVAPFGEIKIMLMMGVSAHTILFFARPYTSPFLKLAEIEADQNNSLNMFGRKIFKKYFSI